MLIYSSIDADLAEPRTAEDFEFVTAGEGNTNVTFYPPLFQLAKWAQMKV
jgi:hypothetical protein